MTIPPSDVHNALDLLDAVVYADVFDAAATQADLVRFARARTDAEAIAHELEDGGFVGMLVSCDDAGVLTLKGREHLAARHAADAARAERLRRRATRVARVLRHTPFVRGLLLTGSVAAGAAPADADVDLLVIVAHGRIATVFALLAPVSRLIGRQVFCPNFYLSDHALAFRTQSVYVGHELGQARPIAGRADGLRRANAWVDEMFPNLPPADEASAPTRGVLQALLELPLRGRLGRAVEERARRLATSRLLVHYHGEVPEDVAADLRHGISLRFHASDVEHSVPKLYDARRRALAAELAAAQSGRSS